MTDTITTLIKDLAHMIKDQRGYTPEEFEHILELLVKEILDANSA